MEGKRIGANPDGNSDAGLVRSSREHGDVLAFGGLVRRYQDLAVRVAFSVLGDAALAEDAAQEAFLYAYTHLEELREPAAFQGWLRRVVFTQALRLTRTKAWLVGASGAESAVDALESTVPGPEAETNRRESRRRVDASLRNLAPHLRVTFALFYIADCTVAEIAETLEVTAGAVRKRLHDARTRLRNELTEKDMNVTKDDLNDALPSRDPHFAENVAALLRATLEGDEPTVKRLLAGDSRLASTRGPHPIWGGEPLPLHVAAERNQAGVVRELLAAGADANGTGADYDGWSPLLLAAHGGRLGIHAPRREIVALLLEAGAEVDIWTAALLGDAARVAELLRADPMRANLPGPATATALHFVREASIADRLLAAGADPAAICGWGTTPLERASFRGAEGAAVADRLMAAGALPHAGTLACLGDLDRLSALLDEQPAALEEQRKIAPSIMGTALHGAAQWGHRAIAQHLLRRGGNVNARADCGQTPLHLAASGGALDLVQVLVEGGADTSACDDEHHTTPLEWARFFLANLEPGNASVSAVVAYLESV